MVLDVKALPVGCAGCSSGLVVWGGRFEADMLDVKRCCAPWRDTPSWAPITDQVAPPWRALVTAAARVASAAPACWWAVATQPRTSNARPAGSGAGVWPLPRVERAALQDGHSATAPYRRVAVSVHRGRRRGRRRSGRAAGCQQVVDAVGWPR